MKNYFVLALALIMVMSVVSYAAPSALDTATSAQEPVIEAVTEAETALAAETANYNIPSGSKLVFDVNFNDKTAGPNSQKVDVVGAYGAGRADAVGEANITFAISGAKATKYNSTVEGSGVSKADDEMLFTYSHGNTNTAGEGRAWPILTATVDSGYFADGMYTICAEVTVPESGNENLTKLMYIGYAKGSAQLAPGDDCKIELERAGKTTYITTNVYVYENKVYCDSKTTLQSTSNTAKSTTKIGLLFDSTSPAKLDTANFIIDDIQMYYKPLECAPTHAVVKFNANGKTVTDLPANITNTKGESISLSATKLADVGTSRFVGWATSPNGKVVTSLTLNENTTLYAIWDDNFYASADEAENGSLVFNMNFNKFVNELGASTLNNVAIRLLRSIQSSFASADTGITLITDASSRDSFRLSIDGSTLAAHTNGAPDKYFNEDDAVIISRSVGVTTNKAGETVPAEVWPKFAVKTDDGYFVDGIYTFVAEFTPEENEYLDFVNCNSYAQVKYTDGTTLKNKETAGSIKTDLPIGESTKASVTIIVHNGVVYDADKLNVIFNGDKNTTFRMGFNFNVKANSSILEKDDQKTTFRIFADNFRMYYKPFKTESYSTNSIRVNSPSGIRFRASVSNFIREKIKPTEYGFIVTRQVLLDKAGITNDNFTHNSEVEKTSGVSYGGDIDRIYEQDATDTYFTAVVHGIPKEYYEDVVVVRPYIIIDGETIYGEAMARSVRSVAESLKKDENQYAQFGDAIDKILNGEDF